MNIDKNLIQDCDKHQYRKLDENESENIWKNYFCVELDKWNLTFVRPPSRLNFWGHENGFNKSVEDLKQSIPLPPNTTCYYIGYPSPLPIYQAQWGFILKYWDHIGVSKHNFIIFPHYMDMIYYHKEGFLSIVNRVQYFRRCLQPEYIWDEVSLLPSYRRFVDQVAYPNSLLRKEIWSNSVSKGFFTERGHIIRVAIPGTMNIPNKIVHLPHLTQFNQHHFSPEDFNSLPVTERLRLLALFQSANTVFFKVKNGHIVKLGVEGVKKGKKLENMDDFSHLEELAIVVCDIKTIPPSVFSLTKLRKMSLTSNCLKSLSPQFHKLKKLRWLDLSYNDFKTFPHNLIQVSSLKELSLSGCKIKEIPHEIQNFPNLDELWLQRAALEKVSPKIGALQNLKFLILDYNKKLTHLPKELCKLSQLIYFSVCNSGLRCLPREIGDLENIVSLDISGTYVRSLPVSICKLKKLEDIAFLIEDWDNLEKDYVDLDIPPCLDKMENLLVLVYDERTLKDFPHLQRNLTGE